MKYNMGIMQKYALFISYIFLLSFTVQDQRLFYKGFNLLRHINKHIYIITMLIVLSSNNLIQSILGKEVLHSVWPTKACCPVKGSVNQSSITILMIGRMLSSHLGPVFKRSLCDQFAFRLNLTTLEQPWNCNPTVLICRPMVNTRRKFFKM